MIKIIKYNLLLVILWSNRAIAQFIEPENEINSPETKSSSLDIGFFMEITTFLFAFVFIISIIGFLFAGLKFMTAGGNESVLGNAHKTWVASLTGLIISLVGYILVYILKMIFL